MIQRFNRYPLVIDPSGQATEFILNEYKDRKITKTRWEGEGEERERGGGEEGLGWVGLGYGYLGISSVFP